MTGLLILSQGDVGNGMLHAIEHVLGNRPERLDFQPIDYHQAHDSLVEALRARIRKLDDGQGVLILADVYGSSHTNAACRLLEPGRVALVSGVNLPMLIRALTYRQLPLDELARKAASGGSEGIVIAPAARATEAGR
jgi:PTS system ascorbate-specific IIA component